MTMTRAYSCNLCGWFIDPSAKSACKGYGISYLSGRRLEFRHMADCGYHICQPCAEGVRDALADLSHRRAAAAELAKEPS